MSEQDENQMSQEQAIQQYLRKKMMGEMQIHDSMVQQGKIQDDIERCPHGIPLERSCRKCDVVTEDQIQERKPLGRIPAGG
jgi:hypothetical protein